MKRVSDEDRQSHLKVVLYFPQSGLELAQTTELGFLL